MTNEIKKRVGRPAVIRKRELKIALEEGLTRKELAERIGCKPTTVQKACDRFGIDLPRSPRGREPVAMLKIIGIH